MPAWWDSVETVNSVTWWLRWIGAVLTFTGAICVMATLATAKRAETLKAAKDKALQDRLTAAEERQRDRHLTAEQRAKILEVLKDSPSGAFNIKVASVHEAQTFANEIAAVMIEAGWKMQGHNTMIGRATPGFGVVAQNDQIPRAVALINALQAAGLPLLTDVWQNEKPDTVILYVGEKP